MKYDLGRHLFQKSIFRNARIIKIKMFHDIKFDLKVQ